MRAVITSLLVAAVCFYCCSAPCHPHSLQSPFFKKIFFSLLQKVPILLYWLREIRSQSNEDPDSALPVRPRANGEGFRLPVSLEVFEQTSERPQALDELPVFREALWWWLGLSNSRQRGVSVVTCQSGPTCPAGKRVGSGEERERKRSGPAASCLCLSAVYLNTGHCPQCH